MPFAQKKPLVVEYMEFDGTNYEDLLEFTEGNFRSIIGMQVPEVYDELHDSWIKVFVGDVVIKGSKGEFYPHEGELFRENYIL